MDIAICSDNNYLGKVLILLISIFENNRDEDICIYLLIDGCCAEDKEKIGYIGNMYGKDIRLLEVNESDFPTLPIYGHLSKSTYYRYLIPLLCKVDKILYLDVDVLVNGSLRELWNTDISNYAMGVVEDAYSENIIESNRLGIYTKRFNNGVALMNLKYWRRFNIAEKCVELLLENKDIFRFMDQDANNVLLHDKVLFLDFKYNMQRQFYGDAQYLFLHKDKISRIKEVLNNPVIVHFNGPTKPWHRECNHPLKYKYLNYANMYSVVGFHDEELHNISYRIVRKFLLEPSLKLLRKCEL